MRANDGTVGGRGHAHAVVGLVVGVMALAISGPAWAIDVKLSPEEARKALEAGRAPMEKAASPASWLASATSHSSQAMAGHQPKRGALGRTACMLRSLAGGLVEADRRRRVGLDVVDRLQPDRVSAQLCFLRTKTPASCSRTCDRPTLGSFGSELVTSASTAECASVRPGGSGSRRQGLDWAT